MSNTNNQQSGNNGNPTTNNGPNVRISNKKKKNNKNKQKKQNANNGSKNNRKKCDGNVTSGVLKGVVMDDTTKLVNQYKMFADGLYQHILVDNE